MHRLSGLLVTAVAVAALAAAVPGAAAQDNNDRNAKQFATGSGKADVATATAHLSFTAHSVAGPGCPAKGNYLYQDSTGLKLKGRVEALVIVPNGVGGGQAFFAGPLQSATVNGEPISTPPHAWFDVEDTGLDGGTGDGVRFETFASSSPCLGPVAAFPITSGNVVIETDPLI